QDTAQAVDVVGHRGDRLYRNRQGVLSRVDFAAPRQSVAGDSSPIRGTNPARGAQRPGPVAEQWALRTARKKTPSANRRNHKA
ncbi:MAG: hypothetical protein KGM91_12020, partial [Burkholderiales bacterium]|nr:hypothetical protein [Burkholderiales bacterium]